MQLSTTLSFTPYAWAKLLFWANAFDHEISGMGITAPDDPLMITDIAIIKQKSSVALTTFDPAAYADFVMEYCDPDGAKKMKPVNCQRIWVHTHPAGVNGPSGRDELTFDESFGTCDWAVMLIMPKGGTPYARMRIKCGDSTVNVMMQHRIAWDKPFSAAVHAEWVAEIDKFVEVGFPQTVRTYVPPTGVGGVRHVPIPAAPTTAATRPAPSNVIPYTPAPFGNDKGGRGVVIPPRDMASNKRDVLTKRERRELRRRMAVQEVQTALSATEGASKRLYSDVERQRTPRESPENIKKLEEAGYEATYMGNGTVLFQVTLEDGSVHNVTFADAWLFHEDKSYVLEQLAGVEYAICTQVNAKTRVLNQPIRLSGPTSEWTEPAEHQYELKAIELDGGLKYIYVTDTELETLNSVASGKTTADEALMILPDYPNVEASLLNEEKTKNADSELTQKAMRIMTGEPEIIVIEGDMSNARTE